MTIPTNLLQSQLALNKNYLKLLKRAEAEIRAEAGVPDDFKELAKCKKQIAKYALLQKSIKQALRDAAYNAKYFPVDCEDF